MTGNCKIFRHLTSDKIDVKFNFCQLLYQHKLSYQMCKEIRRLHCFTF